MENSMEENNKALFNAAIKIEELEERLEGVNQIEIGQPTHTLEQLNKDSSMLDNYTIEWILKYLQLDSYEFVKNIAKTITNETKSEVAIYSDGALARNEALIQALTKRKPKGKDYKDRIAGKMEQK